MRKFDIIFSDQANIDIQNLTEVIINEYHAPQTAFKYTQGLVNSIKKLRVFATILPIQKSAYFEQFNCEVRRINFKKMAILYTVIGNSVRILRVIPSSIICE